MVVMETAVVLMIMLVIGRSGGDGSHVFLRLLPLFWLMFDIELCFIQHIYIQRYSIEGPLHAYCSALFAFKYIIMCDLSEIWLLL